MNFFSSGPPPIRPSPAMNSSSDRCFPRRTSNRPDRRPDSGSMSSMAWQYWNCCRCTAKTGTPLGCSDRSSAGARRWSLAPKCVRCCRPRRMRSCSGTLDSRPHSSPTSNDRTERWSASHGFAARCRPCCPPNRSQWSSDSHRRNTNVSHSSRAWRPETFESKFDPSDPTDVRPACSRSAALALLFGRPWMTLCRYLRARCLDGERF